MVLSAASIAILVILVCLITILLIDLSGFVGDYLDNYKERKDARRRNQAHRK